MARGVLERARGVLETTEFTHAALERVLRAAAQELGVKAGQMFTPIRVAVTGRTAAPPLFETLMVLGREAVLERVDRALVALEHVAAPST
jgi:glutamyl-tRNA synthetase